MRLFQLMLVGLAFGALGCSQAPPQRTAPVNVTGKVTHAGQPLGNVLVTFHPLDVGHPGIFTVNPDGTFSGELVAGNYSYYVGKSTAPTSDAVIKKVDPKYYEANLERSVAVQDGQEILIALD